MPVTESGRDRGRLARRGWPMKHRFVRCVAALLLPLALLPACTRPRRAAIRVDRDLTYGKGGDIDLKLDLARPAQGEGPFPAVVFLHGKGWRAGNRQEMNHFIEGM